MTIQLAIVDSFDGAFAFLSNFHPCYVSFEGKIYRSAEHAYQAAKFNSKVHRNIIANCLTPGRAKNAARKLVAHSDPTFPDRKLNIMECVLRSKFAPGHGDMCRQLLDTAPAELIEGNEWGDRFWGQCEGKGENHLGRLLMKIRDT